MAKNQRPKNKESLPPKKARQPPENKIKIKFEFIDEKGNKYVNGTGRLKICKEGYISFIKLLPDMKWIPIKAKLLSLKITKVPRTVKKKI